MFRRLRSDGLRLSLLVGALLVFPLGVQESPPPEGLKNISSLNIIPLNTYLSERYYTLAVEALAEKNVNLNKAYVAAAIQFDPEAYSVRYKAYQTARDQVLQQLSQP